MSISVMLVDDHQVVRQGIKAILSAEPDIDLVAEASNGREALELARKKNADVIIMDIGLPNLNGLEATQKIIKQDKKAKVLILSMYENRAFVEKALSYGARGYILKDSASNEIVSAIREVNAGRYFLSSKISSFVVKDFINRKKKSPDKTVKSASILTSREREVLQLIAEGQQNKEIAAKLKLSLRTVQVHRNNIMQKLDIHSEAELVKFALREGLSTL